MDGVHNDRPSGRLSRRAFLARASAATGSVLALGALRPDPVSAVAWQPASSYGAEVPAAWFDLALRLVQTTPGYSPPVASRAFGSSGVALFEALAPGMPDRRSLAGRLNGLAPARPPSDAAYHWPTVANAALAAVLRSLFPTTSDANRAAVDDLERGFSGEARAVLPLGIYNRSLRRGADVARHVFAWSTTDGGHEAFLGNPPYTPPTGPGLWVPTPPAFLPAVQAKWGDNRPFVLPSGDVCAPAAPPPHSEDTRSPFYIEARECYDVVQSLTREQEAIARFWSDNPRTTPTPPGHWISILTQVVRARGIPLDGAAEAYAKVGIAVADAFIACWKTKYRHNLLRPITYVRRVIDAGWTPLLETPAFPEYTSGHSVQSAAAAQVLTDLLGSRPFTDRTHESRGLPPRSFQSFAEAAEEAAISRLYGGIHFRAAIERGLEQGACIAARVNALD